MWGRRDPPFEGPFPIPSPRLNPPLLSLPFASPLPLCCERGTGGATILFDAVTTCLLDCSLLLYAVVYRETALRPELSGLNVAWSPCGKFFAETVRYPPRVFIWRTSTGALVNEWALAKNEWALAKTPCNATCEMNTTLKPLSPATSRGW